MRGIAMKIKRRSVFKHMIMTLVITSFLNFPALLFSLEQVSIEILEIKPNEYIKGRVDGLNPAEYEKHKVVVYVKTDKWYIHPFERGGPGKSYATIGKDGKWTIATKKREYLSDYVVALLLRSNYQAPSTAHTLGEIDFVAKFREKGGGRL
jgi:hypothetical protein